MRKGHAVAGSAIFFIVAPGVVAGLIPLWLTGWRMLPGWWPVRVAGAALAVAGVAVLLDCFRRFAGEGSGTPAPVAPTERLVVGGAYRFVRNPMYVSVLAAILGQALLLAQPVLLVYAAAVLIAVASFVRFHEEPVLQRRYGERYERYRSAVPGWIPRLTPWRDEGDRRG